MYLPQTHADKRRQLGFHRRGSKGAENMSLTEPAENAEAFLSNALSGGIRQTCSPCGAGWMDGGLNILVHGVLFLLIGFTGLIHGKGEEGTGGQGEGMTDSEACSADAQGFKPSHSTQPSGAVARGLRIRAV